MYTIMMLTPIDNVKDNRVIDKSKVFPKAHKWQDMVTIGTNDLTELEKKEVCELSIFNDRLHINNEFHIIIHMFSYSDIII